MIRQICFLPVILCCISAASQDTIRVSAAHRDQEPFERRYLQYTQMKDGTVKLSSLLTRKAEKKRYNNHDAMLIVQTYQTDKAIDRDSSYVDARTLLPFSYFTDIQSEGHHEKVVFTGSEIHNSVEYKDSISLLTKPDHGWFNGVVSDDIISSLPLKEKAIFTFHAVNPGKRYFEYTITATVEAKEDLEIPGLGKRSCWRIRIGEEKDGTLEWYTVKEQIQVKKSFRFKNGNIFYRVMLLL